MRKLISLTLLVSAVIFAETPAITAEQRAKFWRAQAEYIAASMKAQQAKAALDAVQSELTQTCGGQQLIAGQDGEPMCALSPEPTKKPAKK